MKPLRIVHIDDDLSYLILCQHAAKEFFGLLDYEWYYYCSYEEFTESVVFDLQLIDCFILDVHLGTDKRNAAAMICEKLRSKREDLPIIVHSSDITSIRGFTAGVADFVQKSKDTHHLMSRVERLLRHKSQEKLSSSHYAQNVQKRHVGAFMNEIAVQVDRIAQSAVRCVYVWGETGTGKEVVAQILKSTLPSQTPFVSVNCAAIAPSLLESELFGHKKGSFTGALSDRKGYFHMADRGWIFLDEIACLPLQAQASILRIIENQELRRVGAQDLEEIDVKVLCATNEPLKELVAKGLFRNDLYQRLQEVDIHLIPLRERQDEVKTLVDYFCQIETGGPYQVTEEALYILKNYSWDQGNVRELRNCLRAMTAFSLDKLLTPMSIPKRIFGETKSTSEKFTNSEDEETLMHFLRREQYNLRRMEHWILVRSLEDLLITNGTSSLTQCAEKLGLAKSTLQSKMKRVEADDPDIFKYYQKILTKK